MTNNPRKAALFVLNQIAKGNKTLDNILEKALVKEIDLSKKDMALFHTLVYGVLRWRARLDFVIDHFSKTRISKINPNVLNILRIGLFQIMFLDRVPVSAAVNTSVELAKSSRAPWIKGFVNGLLRNASRNFENVPYPCAKKDPVSNIAAKKSFPKWLIKRWKSRYGVAQTEKLCDAINEIPLLTIRTNTLKTDRAHLAEALNQEVKQVIFSRFSPAGLSLSGIKQPIAEIGAFKHGWFTVQDEAAQLVGYMVNPVPGMKVLDACAGLGGKTGHIAQLMNNKGQITALDSRPGKLETLEKDMSRLGITIVKTLTHDLNIPPDINKIGTFDRILLDAPCSGLGVIGRNPDTKWSESKKNLGRYTKRQVKFLSNLTGLLKTSGILVYAVCSTEPEENESVVNEFLEKHPEFQLKKEIDTLSDEFKNLFNSKGCLKTSPHENKMDGFFCVSLEKQ